MDADTERLVAETHNMEKVALRMRISELEAALRDILRHHCGHGVRDALVMGAPGLDALRKAIAPKPDGK